MNIQTLQESIEGIDIYILDQILKNRYQPGDKILDAGCGSGRNLKWFYKADYKIYGIDINLKNIEYCKKVYSEQKNHFILVSVEDNPFEENTFDHVICNAVWHFAEDLSQYSKMFKELLRILKPNGNLFIRMASNFGMENQVEFLANGNYLLPNGSTRFLLTTEILNDLVNNKNIVLPEAIKTTIVKDKRCMTTLVIKKVS